MAKKWKNLRQSTRQLLAIDLFSGCGGLTLGLKRAGFKVLAAIEVDERAQTTYRLNHPDVHLYAEDIRDTSAREILKRFSLRRGELNLLAGCPPCQGFSRLRRRNRGNCVRDRRNELLEEFERLARALLPRSIMLENVPSLLKHYRFAEFRRRLRRLGYFEIARVLDVSAYGVPQRRKRLILLASRARAPSMAKPSQRVVTVRQAIGNLPRVGTSGDPLHDMGENRSSRVRQVIAAIPKNGGSRTALPARLQLACHRRVDGFLDIYGRMPWDTLAPTITSGCHNPSKGRFLHPSQNRTISLREAALLQGFPRRYLFLPRHGKEAIALMIGNALPPPFVAAHARALRPLVRAAT